MSENGRDAVQRILLNLQKLEKIKKLITYLGESDGSIWSPKTILKKETTVTFIFKRKQCREIELDTDLNNVLINVLKGVVDAMERGLDEENKDYLSIAKGIYLDGFEK